jgi:hypothetical protein
LALQKNEKVLVQEKDFQNISINNNTNNESFFKIVDGERKCCHNDYKLNAVICVKDSFSNGLFNGAAKPIPLGNNISSETNNSNINKVGNNASGGRSLSHDTSNIYSSVPFSIPVPLFSSSYAPSASPITSQSPQTNVKTLLTNNVVGTKSYYGIVFQTATSGAIGTVDVTFPSGIFISPTTTVEATGLGPGSSSVGGQTLTYTVNSPVKIPAAKTIRLEFANILNPITPNLKVTVTTKTLSGTTIDGPTKFTPYLIKHLDTNDIGNSTALTSSKLSKDPAHLAWQDGSARNFKILYRTNASAVFDPSTLNLTNNTGGGDFTFPAIAVSGNNVYVTWDDDSSGNDEILYTRSTDGGATFARSVNLSNNVGGSTFPAIAVSGNSRT